MLLLHTSCTGRARVIQYQLGIVNRFASNPIIALTSHGNIFLDQKVSSSNSTIDGVFFYLTFMFLGISKGTCSLFQTEYETLDLAATNNWWITAPLVCSNSTSPQFLDYSCKGHLFCDLIIIALQSHLCRC